MIGGMLGTATELKYLGGMTETEVYQVELTAEHM